MLSNRLVQVSQQPNNCFFYVKIKTGGKKKKTACLKKEAEANQAKPLKSKGQRIFQTKRRDAPICHHWRFVLLFFNLLFQLRRL